MNDMFKMLAVIIGLALLGVLYKAYGFAQANNIETFVVFNVALAIIGVSALSIFVAAKIGITEGFCLWLVTCWISLCPLLTALANVNSMGANFGSHDMAWYGTWWFEWGVGTVLVALSGFLLKRKHQYY